MRWLDSINKSMNMSLRKLCDIVKDREAWCAALPSMGLQRIRHDLLTKQQQGNFKLFTSSLNANNVFI